MRKWILMATILVLALSISAMALAQEPTPPAGTVPLPPDQMATEQPDEDDDDDTVAATATPLPPAPADPTAVAPEETITDTTTTTATAAVATLAPPAQAYLTVDLGAGFALDPFFVSVNGGGPIDASTLDPACVGWISERPVVQLNWSGSTDFAEAFIYSDHNPSLVIQSPDGAYHCSDDTNDLLLDPTVEVANPETGTYNIWIGNEDNVGLIPAVLVLTTRSEVNTGTFNLGNLVKRPAIRETLLKAADTVPGFAEIQQQLVDALASASPEITIDSGATITFTQPISGGVPGFVFPTSPNSPFALCNGIVNPLDATFFTVPEGVAELNIFAESDIDGTLIVVDPDGLAHCTDEAVDLVNRNPQLLLADLVPGVYALAVGNVAPEGPAEAIVTITTDLNALPALNERGQIGGSE